MTPMQMAQIRAVAERLKAELGDDYDDETFLDTLDGETDFADVMGGLVDRYEQAEEFASVMRQRAQRDAEAARSWEARKDKLKTAMQALMDAAGQRSVRLPAGTVSVKAVPPKVVATKIVEPEMLPDDLQRKRVDADMRAIAEALKAGREVPGYALSNGGETVQFRRVG